MFRREANRNKVQKYCELFQGDSLLPLLFFISLILLTEQFEHRMWRTHNKDKISHFIWTVCSHG